MSEPSRVTPSSSLPSSATPLQFRLPQGIDCLVHEDAFHALGVTRAEEVDAGKRRLLEAIATEKFEWSSRPASTIVIGEKDVTTHLAS